MVKVVADSVAVEDKALGINWFTSLTTLLAFMKATIGAVVTGKTEARVPVGVMLPAAIAEYNDAAEEAEAKAELKEAKSTLEVSVAEEVSVTEVTEEAELATLLELELALAILALTLESAEASDSLATAPSPFNKAEVMEAIFSIMAESVAVAIIAEACDSWDAKTGLVAVRT